MRKYPTIILLSTIVYWIVSEVLSSVIRLKEMEQLIQDQKQVIEEQRRIKNSSHTGNKLWKISDRKLVYSWAGGRRREGVQYDCVRLDETRNGT